MKTLITGGAGFIGTNSALHFVRIGHHLTLFDNLSRTGSQANIRWLLQKHPSIQFVQGDICSYEQITDVMRRHGPFELIVHLAGQVAVTDSVADPRHDFEVNALGTLNLLEAARHHNSNGVIIYASTNKVYGELEDLEITEKDGRYAYRNLISGVNESRQLDFHSPYGCSKGCADQYCRDYQRIYGLKTIVMRQSCIYGTRQFGVEDQGWLAWFCIATALDKPITICGDGYQVRDVLYIDDLTAVFEKGLEKADEVAGEVFNIGGGSDNILSLRDLIRILESISGKTIKVNYTDWRPGDQKVYVSDTALAGKRLAWRPTTPVLEGVQRLYNWVCDHKEVIGGYFPT
jgi:CDP-paratose 2-epimerase